MLSLEERAGEWVKENGSLIVEGLPRMLADFARAEVEKGCPRCAERIREPLTLDNEMMAVDVITQLDTDETLHDLSKQTRTHAQIREELASTFEHNGWSRLARAIEGA